MVLAAFALLACGVLAMLTDITVLGLSGMAAFTTGAVVLAVSLGPGVLGVIRTVLLLAVLLLGAAPWLPLLRDHVFTWLRGGVDLIHDNPWTRPILLFLLLLPPLMLLAELVRALGSSIVRTARRTTRTVTRQRP